MATNMAAIILVLGAFLCYAQSKEIECPTTCPEMNCPECPMKNPNTWEYPPKKGIKKFVLKKKPSNFFDALHNCRKEGMQLAIVNGPGQNHEVAQITKSIGAPVWIAAEVLGNRGNWVWITTLENVGWFSWQGREKHRDGCMEIDQNGAWIDQNCGERKAYLCERYV